MKFSPEGMFRITIQLQDPDHDPDRMDWWLGTLEVSVW